MKSKILAFILFLSATIADAQKSGNFTSISLESSAKVILHQDSVCSVTTDNGNANTGYSITNGTLTINESANDVFHVGMPSLTKVSINGIGRVTGENAFSGDNLTLLISVSGSMTLNVNYKTITADVSGIGKINLSGTADELKVSIPGSGKIEAKGLKTKKCTASISGIGKCNVDVTDELNVDISGSGSVTYVTEPKVVNKNVSGVGSVKTADTMTTGLSTDTTKLVFGSKEIWIIGKAKKDKKPDTAKPIWAGFELGLNSYIDGGNHFDLKPGNDNWELRTEKSIVASFNFMQKNIQLGKSNIWIMTGLGLTWNNYRFDNNVHIYDGNITVAGRDTNSNVDYLKSKLVVSYLTAPLMLEVLTSRVQKHAFHIAAGGIFGLRIGSHTKQKISEDGETKKLKAHEDFNLNPVRYGFRVAVGYGNFNLFADYNASTLFRKNKGPELYPVSAGITLVGF